jgi:glycosyltransferase involved in cell wall biosynthesis
MTILYQGAVNEARCFESLIPAMHNVNAKLIVCGDGNFMVQARQLVATHGLADKITFTGLVEPEDLLTYTQSAYIGVNIIEDSGLNNHFSLSNRFFDYIQAALPQICVNYPAYREVNDKYHCAFLINDTSPSTIACALNQVLADHQLHQKLKEGCLKAREHLNWNNEKHELISFYNRLVPL